MDPSNDKLLFTSSRGIRLKYNALPVVATTVFDESPTMLTSANIDEWENVPQSDFLVALASPFHYTAPKAQPRQSSASTSQGGPASLAEI